MTAFRKAEGYFERQPDPEFGATVGHCIDRDDGKHFCMAGGVLIASQEGHIALLLETAGGGLFVKLTPAGIRQLCGDLLTVADKVEAAHMADASQLLARTLSRRPPAD